MAAAPTTAPLTTPVTTPVTTLIRTLRVAPAIVISSRGPLTAALETIISNFSRRESRNIPASVSSTQALACREQTYARNYCNPGSALCRAFHSRHFGDKSLN
jgi:hypothetical protein